jgi:hypothetical protein
VRKGRKGENQHGKKTMGGPIWSNKWGLWNEKKGVIFIFVKLIKT